MESEDQKYYLLLGTNLGDKLENLRQALSSLDEIGHVGEVSAVYETPPWGMDSENVFYNLAMELGTSLEPLDLLRTIKEIEKSVGRKTKKTANRFEDRLIDVDILVWEGGSFVSEVLNIPHLELKNRAFSLIPLAEIFPNYIHPSENIDIFQLINRCKDRKTIKKLAYLRP